MSQTGRKTLSFLNLHCLPGFVFDCLDRMVNFAREDSEFFGWNPPLDLGSGRGGAFCVSTFDGLVVCHAYVGYLQEEACDKSWVSAADNAQRLSMLADHLSSWQSCNTRARSEGAVRGDELILPFYGLLGLWDEALMLVVAVQSNSMKLGRADTIAGLSSNPHWPQLRAAFFC